MTHRRQKTWFKYTVKISWKGGNQNENKIQNTIFMWYIYIYIYRERKIKGICTKKLMLTEFLNFSIEIYHIVAFALYTYGKYKFLSTKIDVDKTHNNKNEPKNQGLLYYCHMEIRRGRGMLKDSQRIIFDKSENVFV